jgi:hypothetical protein
MAKTDYARNRILNSRYGDDAPGFVRPATVYLGLFTSAPGVGGGGTEVTGGSYARLAITNDGTNFPDAVSGGKSNGAAFTFATASAGWGTVTHFGFFDALVAGNLLDFAPLTTPKTVLSGDTPSFSIGQLTFQET